MRITQLTPELANQIAAGEVVERPAAVIKELLENSLDAGATRIDIDLEHGGTRLISIRDNGHGIEKDDLALALARHATSKIKTLADLEQVLSLGFRGEALASISAISRLRLISRPPTQEHAWQVQVEGQEMQAVISPASHPVGTTLEVRDLFFNTPARRKFLRSEKTEYGHIEEVLKRFALSHFNVELRVRHNQRDVLQLLPALTQQTKEARLAKILERNFLEHAIVIESAIEGLRLTGWVGMPSFSRSQTDYQFVYLNQRYVRDRVLNHAIKQAYQDQLYEGRQPAYVLYLEIDPTLVDVNVHPTKHEVRFRESRLVHDFIFRALFDGLNQETRAKSQEMSDKPQEVNSYPISESPAYYPTIQIAEPMAYYNTLAHLASQIQNDPAEQDATRLIGTAHDQYLIVETEQGIEIIDQLKAARAILLHQLTTAYEEHIIPHKKLPEPYRMRVSEGQAHCAQDQVNEFKKLGFLVERIGIAELVIRAIPQYCNVFEEKPFLSMLGTMRSGETAIGALKIYVKLCSKSVFNLDFAAWESTFQKLKQLPREAIRNCSQEINLNQSLSEVVYG